VSDTLPSKNRHLLTAVTALTEQDSISAPDSELQFGEGKPGYGSQRDGVSLGQPQLYLSVCKVREDLADGCLTHPLNASREAAENENRGVTPDCTLNAESYGVTFDGSATEGLVGLSGPRPHYPHIASA
jgi:hypothetical protein